MVLRWNLSSGFWVVAKISEETEIQLSEYRNYSVNCVSRVSGMKSKQCYPWTLGNPQPRNFIYFLESYY